MWKGTVVVSSKDLCPKNGWNLAAWYHVESATCWWLVKQVLCTRDVEAKPAPELTLLNPLSQWRGLSGLDRKLMARPFPMWQMS